ncbi:MAG: hypothetical protein MZW92_34715 [Comamonadaceae bacterium]|nr:hypothetical protein [Comamonadaceae bacterium]
MNKTNRALAVAALLAGFGAAQAQDYPVHIVKAGITRYDTHAQTNGVTGIGVPAGADAETTDATTVVLHLRADAVAELRRRTRASACRRRSRATPPGRWTTSARCVEARLGLADGAVQLPLRRAGATSSGRTSAWASTTRTSPSASSPYGWEHPHGRLVGPGGRAAGFCHKLDRPGASSPASR